MDLYSKLDSNRLAIYGLAIISIILYHGYNWTNYKIFSPFKEGFIGVDLFLLLSGYGLCFSYNKNKLSSFYLKRAKRILPSYLFARITGILIGILIFGNETPSLSQLFFRLSTLSFYGIGDTVIYDWFTSSIILLYILFPIIYIILNKNRTVILFIVCFVCCFYYQKFSLRWEWDCFISRLPIFILGIILFYNKNQKFHFLHVAIWLFFWYLGSIFASRFFVTTMEAPFLLTIFILLFSISLKKIIDFLTRIGKYSYEIFLGNCMSYPIISHISFEPIPKIMVYLVCTLFFSLICIYFYKSFLRLVK